MQRATSQSAGLSLSRLPVFEPVKKDVCICACVCLWSSRISRTGGTTLALFEVQLLAVQSQNNREVTPLPLGINPTCESFYFAHIFPPLRPPGTSCPNNSLKYERCESAFTFSLISGAGTIYFVPLKSLRLPVRNFDTSALLQPREWWGLVNYLGCSAGRRVLLFSQ